jgi:hypothetical protein
MVDPRWREQRDERKAFLAGYFYAGGKWGRPTRLGMVTGGLVLIVLVAGVIAAWVGTSGPAKPSGPASYGTLAVSLQAASMGVKGAVTLTSDSITYTFHVPSHPVTFRVRTGTYIAGGVLVFYPDNTDIRCYDLTPVVVKEGLTTSAVVSCP